MYTVKRIIDGDVSGFETADWSISRNGATPGKTFREAVAYARAPSPLDPSDEAQTLADIKAQAIARFNPETKVPQEIQGQHGVVLGDGPFYEIGGVTVIRGGAHDNTDLVLVGANPGTRGLSEALGVVVTTRTNSSKEQEVQYDFVYPGEQVYITDRFGNTVESLR